jgi:hypothetical protein
VRSPRGEHNTVRWAVQQVRLIPERARGLLFSGLMCPASELPAPTLQQNFRLQ